MNQVSIRFLISSTAGGHKEKNLLEESFKHMLKRSISPCQAARKTRIQHSKSSFKSCAKFSAEVPEPSTLHPKKNCFWNRQWIFQRTEGQSAYDQKCDHMIRRMIICRKEVALQEVDGRCQTRLLLRTALVTTRSAGATPGGTGGVLPKAPRP